MATLRDNVVVKVYALPTAPRHTLCVTTDQQ
jgi:hypothetical protein